MTHLDTLTNPAVQPPNSGAPPGGPPQQQTASTMQPASDQPPNPSPYSPLGTSTPPPPHNTLSRFSPKVRIIGAVLLGSIIVIGLITALLVQRTRQTATAVLRLAVVITATGTGTSSAAFTINGTASTVNAVTSIRRPIRLKTSTGTTSS